MFGIGTQEIILIVLVVLLFFDAEFIYANQFRVVRFKIPAAAGCPTCYMGKPYVRIAM